MPNRDGTGPLGHGAGTGRLRGGCAAGRGNNNNNPRKGRGRIGDGNGPRGLRGSDGRRGLNSPSDIQKKQA